jgi:hypothetical protein
VIDLGRLTPWQRDRNREHRRGRAMAKEWDLIQVFTVRAARSGEIDIDSRLNQYKGLMGQLAAQLPPLPPLLVK